MSDRAPLPPSYVAIDLGASSGRVVLGTLEHGRMSMREVHRFATPLLDDAGHLWWDIDTIMAHVRAGLRQALSVSPTVRSISVDSWGVDYLPLAADGRAVRRAYSYRDPRIAGAWERVQSQRSAEQLYAVTGTQFLPFNTLLQVATDLRDEPAEVQRTATRLLIADVILERLSGVAVAEQTLASTTQVYDVTTGTWAADIISAIGDSPSRWPSIVPAGTPLGALRERLARELGLQGAIAPMVIATCSHDTAAAVAAVPAAADQPWAYLSSGTWSLVGVECATPMLTEAARQAGFTNEVGLDGSIRLLKNRMGMWVLEECMREWEARGARPSWEQLFEESRALAERDEHPEERVWLDLETPAFAERGDMLAKIDFACRSRAIPCPESRGSVALLVLRSLAMSYRETLETLAALVGTRPTVLHVVGGGARNTLLNQLTADACACRVVAGPTEATVLGNLLVQARTMGDLPPDVTVRDVARASTTLNEFLPRVAASAGLSMSGTRVPHQNAWP